MLKISPKLKRINKILHIAMISLCIIATVLLFSINGLIPRFLVCLLILAYTYFAVVKINVLREVIGIDGSYNSAYNVIHECEEEGRINVSFQTRRGINSNNNKNNITKDSFLNNSMSDLNVTSQNRTIDLKDKSMSIIKSVASRVGLPNILNGKSNGQRQFNGRSLDDYSRSKKDDNQSSLSRSYFDKSSSRLDLSEYQEEDSSVHENQNNEDLYAKFMESLRRFNKDYRDLAVVYPKIRVYLRKIAHHVLRQHTEVTTRIKEVFEKFYEVQIYDSNVISNSRGFRSYATLSNRRRITLQQAVCQALDINRSDSQALKQLDMVIKDLGSSKEFVNHIKNRVLMMSRFADQYFGIDTILTESKLPSASQQFWTLYSEKIRMIELFYNCQAKNEELDLPVKKIKELGKARIYMIYLFVKEMNKRLPLTSQLKFQDSFKFKYPKYTSAKIQILKCPEDDMMPIYCVVDKMMESEADKYYCQPGQNNYLSIVHFIFLVYKKHRESSPINEYVRMLINEFA